MTLNFTIHYNVKCVDMGKLHCGMRTQQWNNGIVECSIVHSSNHGPCCCNLYLNCVYSSNGICVSYVYIRMLVNPCHKRRRFHWNCTNYNILA